MSCTFLLLLLKALSERLFVTTLLCLAKHGCSPRFAEVLYLWNPSIRKFKRFPNSCLSQYIWMATGFAYQSQSHDCKVVEIFCLCPYKEIEPKVAAEVYTLCWD